MFSKILGSIMCPCAKVIIRKYSFTRFGDAGLNSILLQFVKLGGITEASTVNKYSRSQDVPLQVRIMGLLDRSTKPTTQAQKPLSSSYKTSTSSKQINPFRPSLL